MISNVHLMVLFKTVFGGKYEISLTKKSEFLDIGKIRKYDEERVFLPRKERSQLLKLNLDQIGKAQIMHEVAGRLVYFTLTS